MKKSIDNMEALDHLRNMGCKATDDVTGVRGRISEVIFAIGGTVLYQLEWAIGDKEGIAQLTVDAGRVTLD